MTVRSPLLGLFDADNRLNHVGFISGLVGEKVAALTARLK
jgi:hypothetical protein